MECNESDSIVEQKKKDIILFVCVYMVFPFFSTLSHSYSLWVEVSSVTFLFVCLLWIYVGVQCLVRWMKKEIANDEQDKEFVLLRIYNCNNIHVKKYTNLNSGSTD